MKALKSLRQLLQIRSLRADNLSRSLSEARADAESAREREAKASEALDIAASRAAGNPVVDALRKSDVISAAELQDALMRQSVLRSHEADASLSLAQRKAARRAAQERAEHVAADFSRAQKAVLRTEFSLEAAEKIDR
ncbi:hypothetical protein PYR71_29240 [Rhizobium sp. MC63]|uniref:Uncharacterized protein n=5 Tax=Rhizobium TaxID=379 RepID=A0A1C3Y9T6_9HYPH|nr:MULTISPECIES: hypothetical protein [Rhizobium]ANL37174.1 hypothetical protein AMC89_PC00092 [Rhizobium phaseoli]ANL49803.1 hypothetical protein AMC87_PC00102 [Rhizobium phaseoli]ANM00891.1 hypothetical protein AMC79_PC00088 [Rhizobium phaseoli]MCJ9692763.1 hypothetical protein [Rhizobium sp. PRIMUS64]MDC7746861.1 hypothetical protein [Rhizobium sp. BC56]